MKLQIQRVQLQLCQQGYGKLENIIDPFSPLAFEQGSLEEYQNRTCLEPGQFLVVIMEGYEYFCQGWGMGIGIILTKIRE